MATAVWAHPNNYGTRGIRTNYIEVTIHCTDGKSYARPVAEMWQDPNMKKKSSAHFVIDQDGTTLQCVPLRYAAYHAHDRNVFSVGIEHCARTPREFTKTDPGLPPSSAQYLASARLVAYLLVAAGLPPDRTHVRGHAESDKKTTHDRCPEGCGWNWDYYMTLVREEYAKLAPEKRLV